MGRGARIIREPGRQSRSTLFPGNGPPRLPTGPRMVLRMTVHFRATMCNTKSAWRCVFTALLHSEKTLAPLLMRVVRMPAQRRAQDRFGFQERSERFAQRLGRLAFALHFIPGDGSTGHPC